MNNRDLANELIKLAKKLAAIGTPEEEERARKEQDRDPFFQGLRGRMRGLEEREDPEMRDLRKRMESHPEHLSVKLHGTPSEEQVDSEQDRQHWLSRLNDDVKDYLSLDKTQLLGVSSFGSYPVFYLDKGNNTLCAKCASNYSAEDNEIPVSAETNWEDPNLYCDSCSKRIESAYAED